jgi:hypothetical protein
MLISLLAKIKIYQQIPPPPDHFTLLALMPFLDLRMLQEGVYLLKRRVKAEYEAMFNLMSDNHACV